MALPTPGRYPSAHPAPLLRGLQLRLWVVAGAGEWQAVGPQVEEGGRREVVDGLVAQGIGDARLPVAEDLSGVARGGEGRDRVFIIPGADRRAAGGQSPRRLLR